MIAIAIALECLARARAASHIVHLSSTLYLRSSLLQLSDTKPHCMQSNVHPCTQCVCQNAMVYMHACAACLPGRYLKILQKMAGKAPPPLVQCRQYSAAQLPIMLFQEGFPNPAHKSSKKRRGSDKVQPSATHRQCIQACLPISAITIHSRANLLLQRAYYRQEIFQHGHYRLE